MVKRLYVSRRIGRWFADIPTWLISAFSVKVARHNNGNYFCGGLWKKAGRASGTGTFGRLIFLTPAKLAQPGSVTWVDEAAVNL